MRFEESLYRFLAAEVPSAEGDVNASRLSRSPGASGLRYVIGDGEDLDDQDGYSGATLVPVDVDCYGLTYDLAKTMARQVARAFRTHKQGGTHPLVSGGPAVGVGKIGTPSDDYDEQAQEYVVTVPVDLCYEDEDE